MRTRRLRRRDLLYLVGAEELYLRVELCQTESQGSRSLAAFIGQKSPIFDTFRLPYTENFRQGFQSVLWQRTLRARHPRILVEALQKLPTLSGGADV